MKKLEIGRSGLDISAISLGTMHASVPLRQRSSMAITEAIEAGVNYIDTADSYNQQGCKQVVDVALSTVSRDKLRIGTKCFFPTGNGLTDRGLGREHILRSIDTSLSNLNVEYFDLFFLHRYDAGTPMEETISAIQTLLRSGKVRHWGFSAFTPFQSCEVYYTAQKMDVALPIVAQYAYNLFNRTIEMDVAEVLHKLGISIMAYYPLAQGVLSGKYGDDKTSIGRASDPALRKLMWDFSEEKLKKAQLFAAFARDHGCAPTALALAWCLRNRNVCSVLTNISSSHQWTENLTSTTLQLSDDIWNGLETIFGNPPINPYTGAAY